MSLIRTKQRVAEHGEVFTPPWLVDDMLNLVNGEVDRIDSRFLETACGSGNFLIRILQLKLAAVQAKYGKSEFEKKHYALLGLMCIYGVELLADNIAECRQNLMSIFSEYLDLNRSDDMYRAALSIISDNLVHGDARTMRTDKDEKIMFPEWGYIGKGKFIRRDFRLDALSQSSNYRSEAALFAHYGKHVSFIPTKTYPPMSVDELANRSLGTQMRRTS